jgi:hypothetical protein
VAPTWISRDSAFECLEEDKNIDEVQVLCGYQGRKEIERQERAFSK